MQGHAACTPRATVFYGGTTALSLLNIPSGHGIGLRMNATVDDVRCSKSAPVLAQNSVRPWDRCSDEEYSSGEGRLYAEDVIVNIEGAAGTMIVSV